MSFLLKEPKHSNHFIIISYNKDMSGWSPLRERSEILLGGRRGHLIKSCGCAGATHTDHQVCKKGADRKI
jgi:hypothetical protein